MLLKLFNGLFLAAFLLSALVQYNDPDSLPWILLYLIAAAQCIAWQSGRLPKWVPVLLVVASAVWAGSLMPAIVGKVSPSEVVQSLGMQTRAVEEAREIGGLLIVTLWSAVLWHNLRHTAEPS